MKQKGTVSVRIPVQTHASAVRVAEQTGESITAVIAKAVRAFEDDLFYERLAAASASTFDGGKKEASYRAECEPWMNTGLAEAVRNEPAERLWR